MFYNVYTVDAKGAETDYNGWGSPDLRGCQADAYLAAEDIAEGGRTGRAIVRDETGYMVYSLEMRGDYYRVYDEALGDTPAVYVFGEYAYLYGFKPERARFKAELIEARVGGIVWEGVLYTRNPRKK